MHNTYTQHISAQLLQFKPTNAHNFIKVTILQHTSCYMFCDSLAHHQGTHSCTKQLLNVFCMYELVCSNTVTSINLCAFDGSNCNNWIAMYKVENVKYFSPF